MESSAIISPLTDYWTSEKTLVTDSPPAGKRLKILNRKHSASHTVDDNDRSRINNGYITSSLRNNTDLSSSANSSTELQKRYLSVDLASASKREKMSDKMSSSSDAPSQPAASGVKFRQQKQRLEFFLNTVNHICIGFVTIYLSWLCIRLDLVKTALHAWLATIGFCLLMAEAIMCHYEGNVLTFSYTRKTKTTIHWVLQVLGGGCGIAGCLVKMIQKGFLFKTIHGKLGLAAFILCFISMSSGLCALFSQRLKNILKPLLSKTFHNFLGISTFVLGMAAQYYGYETGFFRKKVTEDFQFMIKIITLISLFLSSIGPLKALFQKCLNIFRSY